MESLKYKDFLADLASGSTCGVFIDDTGSPGLQSTPANLHPERKTWVGVVVPAGTMPEVLTQFPGAIKELQKWTGASEFHFVDIWGRTKEFKQIDLQTRLSIFRFMAFIFQKYKFPIFVQTFDPNTIADLRRQTEFPKTLGPFDLTKEQDLALVFLLLRIKRFIEKDRKNPSILARVFIDEGFKRNGIAICIPPWKTVFSDGLICFARSSTIYLIQLADFAAFGLNRTQLLIGKKNLNSLDKQLLEILAPIVWNYQNVEKKFFSLSRIDTSEDKSEIWNLES